ncbi:MAG: heme exporter protein CcmD [Phenylobacterium sp.]
MLDLDAGKYAAFVWPAYAITAMVWGFLIAASLAHARRWKAKAEALGRK